MSDGDIRSLAVEIVDYVHGYTYEFSNQQATHLSDYDWVEERLEVAYVLVAEGWWHPNTNAGRVHDHPDNPGRGWSVANHRLCEPVYTRRAP